jgi:medium-chain acyl-[acyl-carrier-protein] hydrolase
MIKIKLFCFPYAGGSALVFNPWKDLLGSFIELCPLELAGRGTRIKDPLYESVDEATDDAFNMIKNDIERIPYAFYGHSMGSMMAYALTNKLMERKQPSPLHLFLSGRRAPHFSKERDRMYHLMAEDQFKEELINLGGTPKEFFDIPELLEVLLPPLKNDFRLNETYLNDASQSQINCPMTIFSGKEDDVSPEEVEGWRIHTKNQSSVHFFDGGHFFINKEKEIITRTITQKLQKVS